MSAAPRIANGLTVDVEDYFQVSAFDSVVPRTAWHRYESRVCRNTGRLLATFNEAGVKGTFFVLGWIAERFPDLVKRIAAEGHEIASHGCNHQLVYTLSEQGFREDIRRSKDILEGITGRSVRGYRAPSFSITNKSLWALDVLVEEGFAYDASIFPIYHDRYGIAGSARHPVRIRRPAGAIVEVPGSTVAFAGLKLPIAGGGYFRLLPYRWTRWGIRRVNGREGKPICFYLHPWEIDPEQPRISAPPLSTFRHYLNLARTEPRLRRLLREFRFAPLERVLGDLIGDRVSAEIPSTHRAPPSEQGAHSWTS